jgi:hypothetical protein
MGGTANEVGEFAERLCAVYYNAKQLPAAAESEDLITYENKRIQVKSRKIDHLTATSLNVIRSWNFHILAIVIFGKDGNILHAIEISATDAEKLSTYNKHQNGYILTTSKELLYNEKSTNITDKLQNIIDGKAP